ncbi:MAG: tetratricopeptide repeat protein [Planctomycetota bacterium]|jgi:tetratricopeptide (TPR) repeat protein
MDELELELLAAEAQLRSGDLQQAVDLYTRIVKQDPRRWPAYLGLARATLYAGQVDAAEQCLTVAERLAPDHPDTLVVAGLLAEVRGDLAGAASKLRAATGQGPKSFMAWFNLGRVLGQQGEAAEAIAALERACSLDGGSYDAHYALGTVCHGAGRADRAIEAFSAAMSIDPDNVDIYATLADVLLATGDSALAAKTLEEGLSRHPGNEALRSRRDDL